METIKPRCSTLGRRQEIEKWREKNKGRKNFALQDTYEGAL